MIWNGEFSYDAFERILGHLKGNFTLNYLIREIPQIFSQIHRPKFIIRHDVIRSPRKAAAMAEIESRLSVASAYMFCVDSTAYHPAEGDAPAAIQRIRGLGHEVGLYAGFSGLPGNRVPAPDEVERSIRRRCRELEKAVRFPVLSVSLPNPHPGLPERSLFLGRKVNAASSMMMAWHVSDESPPWRAEAIAPRPAKPYAALLQVVIHPHLWG